jgi:hypothetical protein
MPMSSASRQKRVPSVHQVRHCLGLAADQRPPLLVLAVVVALAATIGFAIGSLAGSPDLAVIAMGFVIAVGWWLATAGERRR